MGWGLITHSRKNKTITETEDIQISINIDEATRAHSSRMTHFGQSQKETRKPTASIVNLKLETRIGNWNVRTMFETGKASQVAREMERYKLDIRHRRWNWIGHIMRRDREEHCVAVLEWRAEWRRPGRPKTAWRRMVEDERRMPKPYVPYGMEI